MAMGIERLKALHNFTLPSELRWGNRQFLRCMKINSNGQISPLRRFTTTNSYSSDQHQQNNYVQQPRTTRDRERRREKESSAEFLHGSHKVGPSPPPASDGCRRFGDDDDGIAAMREKVMFDLQTATDKMKDAIFKDGLEEGQVSGPQLLRTPSAAAAVEGEICRPWNLRTRRAACKTPLSGLVLCRNGGATVVGAENDSAGGKGLRVDIPKSNLVSSQMRAGSAAVADNSTRLRSADNCSAACGEKRERAKFSVSLCKRDIEEDFLAIVGHRLPRRPKKRAKIIQRQLDTLFPGVWLIEVTPDMYKVPEAAP
ncbi:uncharacterized protein LOC105160775 [Sesamum indicum]|uniref:Uncharacterized protein LOC105160775 n=1 Tax=Sesamum indicum TaxID=4182 RepID=A0A6I9T7S4_SESIN|nr:uncharacterized protein LOC105160775 [Sesamum indicum]